MTVPSTISAPRYDAAAVVPSVVHLGLGAFHRAHQAAYADDVLATGSLSGGICAVSLRNSTLPAALSRQGTTWSKRTMLVIGSERSHRSGRRSRLDPTGWPPSSTG